MAETHTALRTAVGSSITAGLTAKGRAQRTKHKKHRTEPSIEKFWAMVKRCEQRLATAMHGSEIVKTYREFMEIERFEKPATVFDSVSWGALEIGNSRRNQKFWSHGEKITYGEVVKPFRTDGGVPAESPGRTPCRIPPSKKGKTKRKKGKRR